VSAFLFFFFDRNNHHVSFHRKLLAYHPVPDTYKAWSEGPPKQEKLGLRDPTPHFFYFFI